MFFMRDGIYEFDATKLRDAHGWCQAMVGSWMSDNEERIIVSNTFTQEWEMQPYYDLAEKYGYRVYSLVVENRHGGINEHGVPEDKLEIMRNRFEIKL
jgi:hypothetical protein